MPPPSPALGHVDLDRDDLLLEAALVASARGARDATRTSTRSSSSRESFHSFAISSAEIPCITMSKRSVTSSDIEPRFEPIGTRDIISTPPETTRSSWPDHTAAAALKFVCIDEPHCRSTVVPHTVTGQPAVSATLRPMFHACSSTCVTQPHWRSSICAGIDVVSGDQRRSRPGPRARRRGCARACRSSCRSGSGRRRRSPLRSLAWTWTHRIPENQVDAEKRRQDRAARRGAALRRLLEAGAPRGRRGCRRGRRARPATT